MHFIDRHSLKSRIVLLAALLTISTWIAGEALLSSPVTSPAASVDVSKELVQLAAKRVRIKSQENRTAA
jgi:hypothetical protein